MKTHRDTVPDIGQVEVERDLRTLLEDPVRTSLE
jgi:hypothetical protein